MREIKFRAWDIDAQEMKRVVAIEYGDYEGPEYNFPDMAPRLLSLTEMEGTHLRITSEVPADTCILMQFTGLKDKNGKEIYEGDIIFGGTQSWSKNEAVEFKAIKIPNCCCSSWEVAAWYVGENPLDSLAEVIGNIHQNPELLTNE